MFDHLTLAVAVNPPQRVKRCNLCVNMNTRASLFQSAASQRYQVQPLPERKTPTLGCRSNSPARLAQSKVPVGIFFKLGDQVPLRTAGKWVRLTSKLRRSIKAEYPHTYLQCLHPPIDKISKSNTQGPLLQKQYSKNVHNRVKSDSTNGVRTVPLNTKRQTSNRAKTNPNYSFFYFE